MQLYGVWLAVAMQLYGVWLAVSVLNYVESIYLIKNSSKIVLSQALLAISALLI